LRVSCRFSRGDRVSRMGCVCPKPHLSGLVCPKPRTAALITWGACAPSPAYRGLCAPSPERPRRRPLPAATCHVVTVASITRRRARRAGWTAGGIYQRSLLPAERHFQMGRDAARAVAAPRPGPASGHEKADARSAAGVGASRRRPAPLPARLFARYCGCGSDSRLVSSWMSTATSASALAWTRPWCAQNSSSPELASSTRTYAWAPQRSQTSRAVSGLVGAIAPVNVASFASCLRLLGPSGSVLTPYRSVQHIPRRRRSLLRLLYATSETASGHFVFTFPAVTRGARVPPGRDPAAHRHRVSLADIYPIAGG
jgi:hypothetical protein